MPAARQHRDQVAAAGSALIRAPELEKSIVVAIFVARPAD
jgi:hypothetical protein